MIIPLFVTPINTFPITVSSETEGTKGISYGISDVALLNKAKGSPRGPYLNPNTEGAFSSEDSPGPFK